MEPFIGQIILLAFPRVPSGWLACDGQELSVTDFDVLFGVIGTIYGGDGVATFKLPDLRGRLPVHFGQGIGLSMRDIGQSFGTEQVTLTSLNLPVHTHILQASATAQGNTGMPGPTVGFASASGVTPYTTAPTGAATVLAAQSIAAAGGGQPHDNMMPTMVMNYCIAYQGDFPTQV